MRKRLIVTFAVVAALALAGATILLTQPAAPKAQFYRAAPASIAPLPEQPQASPTPDSAMTDLQRCVDAGQCQLVRAEKFGKATFEVFQQTGEQPALHIVTSLADGDPQLWSLEGEHAATYQAMTCGLANCVLDVVVGPESVASIDMRLVSGVLSGQIEGAAVGPSLSVTATDLNSDGVLDLVTAEHLVQADGSELFYYRTFVNEHRQLVATGCTTPAEQAPAPSTLQARTCPTR